jgi:hypothetical protein
MSSEEEKVSRAFLQSVLRAESAEASEPEEIIDPESDERLAAQLAQKYARSPKAQKWFRRPALLFGAAAVAAAAAVMILLYPRDPENPSLTAFQVEAKPTDRVLQVEPAQQIIRLHESSTWELSLSAQVAGSGDTNVRSFVHHSDAVAPIALPLQRTGHNFKLRVDSSAFSDLSRAVDLCVVICRAEATPSERRLRKLLADRGALVSGSVRSVRLPIGDCQLVRIRVEP